jgi:hypothetical protein
MRRPASPRRMARHRAAALPDDRPAAARPAHLLFAGDPPASWRRGLEPAFLLLDSDLMELLTAKAAAIGTTYDFLLRTILREHIQEY